MSSETALNLAGAFAIFALGLLIFVAAVGVAITLWRERGAG